MRILIGFLIFIMLVLISNIVIYSVSEDYRFFLKKIKYSQEVVYDDTLTIDDSRQIEVLDTSSPETETTIKSDESLEFLDVLSGREDIQKEEEKRELTEDEREFIEAFKERFVLSEEESYGSLFDITTEYPDDYYEFKNKHISVYVFQSKSYEEVLKIFQVLEYELPYTINEVNNFADASFYINLDDAYSDGIVRLVLNHKNTAFWLKIKKDSYNTVKEILSELSSK